MNPTLASQSHNDDHVPYNYGISAISQMASVSLKDIVEQVLKHLIQIMDQLLQEHILTQRIGLRLQSDIAQSIESSVLTAVDQKIDMAKKELLQRISALKSHQSKTTKMNDQTNLLKEKRKAITESILQFQRTNSLRVQTSPKLSKILKGNSSDEIKADTEIQGADMMVQAQVTSVSQRLSQWQKSQSRKMKQMLDNIEQKMDRVYEDMKKLSEKQLQVKVWVQERMQSTMTGFESIWNVLSNIEQKLADKQR